MARVWSFFISFCSESLNSRNAGSVVLFTVSLSYTKSSSLFRFLTILKNEHVPPKNHHVFMLGKFLAFIWNVKNCLIVCSYFSHLITIFPCFLPLVSKSLTRPCSGEPNISPSEVSVRPTSLGGFAS